MAKEKSDAELREKKEKKEKKRKREEDTATTAPAADQDGAAAGSAKKDKKKKRKSVDAAHAVDENGDVVMDAGPTATAQAVDMKDEEDGEKKEVVRAQVPLLALVPFANPLADEKAQKKVLKSVKRAAKSKALKRGVKECVKAIRKSPPANPSALTSTSNPPPGIVILAADISPMDVISHIPVLCEDHNIPYIFVPSRAELGAAGSTKRPTSVVLISSKAGKGKEDDGEGEWDDTYKDLHKLALKLTQTVKV